MASVSASGKLQQAPIFSRVEEAYRNIKKLTTVMELMLDVLDIHNGDQREREEAFTKEVDFVVPGETIRCKLSQVSHPQLFVYAPNGQFVLVATAYPGFRFCKGHKYQIIVGGREVPFRALSKKVTNPLAAMKFENSKLVYGAEDLAVAGIDYKSLGFKVSSNGREFVDPCYMQLCTRIALNLLKVVPPQ